MTSVPKIIELTPERDENQPDKRLIQRALICSAASFCIMSLVFTQTVPENGPVGHLSGTEAPVAPSPTPTPEVIEFNGNRVFVG